MPNPLYEDQPVDFDFIQDIIVQFKLKRGDVNEGHALDTICRKCGSRGPFLVQALQPIRLARNGETVDNGKVWWLERNLTTCEACGFESCMDEFFVPALDAVLAKSGCVEFARCASPFKEST